MDQGCLWARSFQSTLLLHSAPYISSASPDTPYQPQASHCQVVSRTTQDCLGITTWFLCPRGCSRLDISHLTQLTQAKGPTFSGVQPGILLAEALLHSSKMLFSPLIYSQLHSLIFFYGGILDWKVSRIHGSVQRGQVWFHRECGVQMGIGGWGIGSQREMQLWLSQPSLGEGSPGGALKSKFRTEDKKLISLPHLHFH